MMSHSGVIKTSSISSFTSDQLDEEENEALDFDVAPYDIVGSHSGVGEVVVARTGAVLPMVSKFFKKDGGDVAVKFQVSRHLDVSVFVERPVKKKKVPNLKQTNVGQGSESNEGQHEVHGVVHPHPAAADKESQIIDNLDQTLDDSILNMNNSDVQDISDVLVGFRSGKPDNQIVENLQLQSVKKFRSSAEFLTMLNLEFESIVIGGVESGYRNNIVEKMKKGEELIPTENMKVVHALNQVYHDEYGSTKPDSRMCQSLGELLKSKFPQTFKVQKVVKTSFGTLKVKRSKGEGGVSDLAKRIGDAFYDRFSRKSVKRPSSSLDGSSESRPESGKRMKKVYCITAEKWNLGLNSTKQEKDEGRASFRKISEVDTEEEKMQMTLSSAAFIQEQFRELQPSQAVEDLKVLLSDKNLLSLWFEFMVSGSKDGSLAVSVDLQMPKVISIVEQYLLSKKGSDFEGRMNGAKEIAELHCGNDVDYKVFLLRELGILFKNKPEKLIFLDGVDDKSVGPNDQQPNVFITRQNTMGMDEYEEKVEVSVRIGDKVLFKGVGLSQAIAACIQLHFIFNMHYPQEADDLSQFCQRILCNFGDHDGARNKKGAVKKCFRDFESFAAQLLLESDQGELLALIT